MKLIITIIIAAITLVSCGNLEPKKGKYMERNHPNMWDATNITDSIAGIN